MYFQGVYNFTGGIRISFQGIYNSTGTHHYANLIIFLLLIYFSSMIDEGGIYESLQWNYKPPEKISESL